MISLFFFNDTATTEIYTLSLHDALPILFLANEAGGDVAGAEARVLHQRGEEIDIVSDAVDLELVQRSEEHTSELQSRQYLVCRLLLEKKKIATLNHHHQAAPIPDRKSTR